MNLLVLYLVLLKATLTSFSGLTSLPMIHDDLVVQRQVLTGRQLNAAVVAGRTVPGPNGAYVVSVGYFIAGSPGALMGYLAMITPAFLMILLLRFLGSWAGHPRVKSAIDCVMLAAAGLIAAATLPLARDALTGLLPSAIAVTSAAMIVFTRRDTLWIIGGAAVIGLAGGWIGL